MSKDLGPRPNLIHLRKQAKDLLAACRHSDGDAIERVKRELPWLGEQPPALHDAQSVVAREYGFTSWAQLVRHVQVRQTLDAARAGDEHRLVRLLKKDPSLASAADPTDCITPLREAAAAGNVRVVKMLLAHGADPNALDVGDNASPLHFAAERGHLDVVELLVEAGADVNWKEDVHELGPLGWATFFGAVHVDVANYLIERGARLDMFSAIALGRTDDVRQIAHEDPAVLDKRSSECDHRKSPIEFAAAKKQFAIARLLVELGATVGLVEAAALGETEAVCAHLRESRSKGEMNRALVAAVAAGKATTVSALLEEGANPNHGQGTTSVLFDAILAADRPIAELLLRHGADLERRDDYWKSTPLGWAIFFGKPDSCRLAISLGALIEPQLLDLARSGEQGELRSWSSGTVESFRKVIAILEESM